MEAMPQTVKIYSTSDGTHPFEDWFNGLQDQQAKRKVRVRIARARAGNFGDSKSVGEGVVELRINFGPGYRVYFGRDGDTLVILLCGGNKKSQENDIAVAKQYWRDYKEGKL